MNFPSVDTPPAAIVREWKPGPRHWWLLGIVLAFLYLFYLGARGLNNPDEGRYANIAAAMARPGGDWWEPRESGLGHYDKPPLIYWCTAASLRVFGHNEWAARVPSFLGAAMSLAGLAWAASRLYGARIGWWSTFISGTTVQVWIGAHILSPDMLLAGLCTLAVAAWVECRHRSGAWSWWFVMLSLWTLAWWTKATAALVPLAGLLLGTFATADRAGRRALRPWLLLPSIIAFGSPWYLMMLARYPELSSFFFHRELVQRIAGQVDGRHGPFFYYVLISPIAWLPWWPLAAWKWWRRNGTGQRSRAWLARIRIEGWIVLAGIAIFSLVSSKLATYTLPLAPWAALTFARLLCANPETSPSPSRLMPGVAFAVAMLIAIVVVPPLYESRLGSNSSLRPVCQFLASRGATAIECDRYWPDTEFYLPEAHIRYLARPGANQRERPSDVGEVPDRFVDPLDWLGLPGGPGAVPAVSGERWLVRYRNHGGSPFETILQATAECKVTCIGQFDVYHVTLKDGKIASPPP